MRYLQILWILPVLLASTLTAQERGLRTQGKEQALAGFYDRTWAIIIGIDDYPNLSYQQQLQQAVRDARGVEQVVRTQYRFDRIITLYNEQATKEGIQRLLLGDLSESGENDGVFIFFAGHGTTISTAEGDLGYLIPYDGSFEEKEKYKNISMTTLKNDVAKGVPAKHVFFVMDACYSGLLLAERGPGDQLPDAGRLNYLRAVTRERVRLVLAAGGKGQTVLDGGRNGHSVFTGRFLQALEEADGYITGKELGYQVPEKVFYDAQDRGHKQQPQFGRLSGQGDFVFVRKEVLETPGVVPPLPPPTPAPLTPPPAAVQFGHLQVNVNAANSQVYINGAYRGVASPGAPLNLQNVGLGQVTVKVTASGYQEKTQRFSLQANTWMQAVVELEPVVVAPPPTVETPKVRPSSRPSASATGGRAGETRTFALPGGASIEMMWIEPGTFLMGSPDTEPGRYSDEGPQHRVTLSRGFWLGKYELTQKQWEAVMGSNPSTYKGANRPVEQVSWKDVQGFIGKLNQSAGQQVYRLPTEAEWEYACRAGTSSVWPFGNSESLLGSYAWYSGNNSPSGTKEVGQKQPNGWGLYDMLGNVYEWCQDWKGSYSSGSQTDPMGLSSGADRVYRGGGFGNTARYARPAYRSNNAPGYRYYYVGFRLLRTP